jgi:hypothetical protein
MCPEFLGGGIGYRNDGENAKDVSLFEHFIAKLVSDMSALTAKHNICHSISC